MKRKSDIIHTETIDQKLIIEQNQKKRKTIDFVVRRVSEQHSDLEHSHPEKQFESEAPYSKNEFKEFIAQANGDNSIDRFLRGLFKEMSNNNKDLNLEDHNPVKDLNKTYLGMPLTERDENQKQSVEPKDFKRIRKLAKENKIEDTKTSQDLKKKIENIGDVCSDFDKSSVPRLNIFSTQSYSGDSVNDDNDKNLLTLREALQSKPMRFRTRRDPSENLWQRRKEQEKFKLSIEGPIDQGKRSQDSKLKPKFSNKSSAERCTTTPKSKLSMARRSRSISPVSVKKSISRSQHKSASLKKAREAKFEERLREEEKKRQEEEQKRIELERVLKEENDYLKNILMQKDFLLDQIREEFEQIRKQLTQSEHYRSELHNHLQELRGNLRIFCRVKPIGSRSQTITYPDKNSVESSEPSLKSLELGQGGQKKVLYHFDRVFDEDSTQFQIFEEIKPFVQSAIDGQHVCILAYGQTGSGKTYTMEGPNLATAKFLDDHSGVLPRSVEFIFEEIKRQSYRGISVSLELACLEIYNDNLSDLLSDCVKKNLDDSSEKEKESSLSITFVNGRVNIQGLTWSKIINYDQLISLISKASNSRVTEKTNWNEKSSRSHCIYTLRLKHSDGKEGILNIVDLAGSERADPKTLNDKSAKEINLMKKIQTEASHINKSLTTLGRIIRLISEKKSGVLPYRECKLTRVLQDCLGGNAKTLMFINVCPSLDNLNQTKESLTFSSKASL